MKNIQDKIKQCTLEDLEYLAEKDDVHLVRKFIGELDGEGLEFEEFANLHDSMARRVRGEIQAAIVSRKMQEIARRPRTDRPTQKITVSLFVDDLEFIKSRGHKPSEVIRLMLKDYILYTKHKEASVLLAENASRFTIDDEVEDAWLIVTEDRKPHLFYSDIDAVVFIESHKIASKEVREEVRKELSKQSMDVWCDLLEREGRNWIL